MGSKKNKPSVQVYAITVKSSVEATKGVMVDKLFYFGRNETF